MDNKDLICYSLRFFDLVNTTNLEEQALIYETFVAIDCGRNKYAFLLEASKLWSELGHHNRAKLLKKMAYGNKLYFKFLPGYVNQTVNETPHLDITVFQVKNVVRNIMKLEFYNDIYPANNDTSSKVASGTLVKKFNNKWYAPNEQAVFMFELEPEMVYQPTTRFLRPDLAVVIDTYGLGMLVEQTLRYNASRVVGCCNGIGNQHARKYLADRGIKSICVC